MWKYVRIYDLSYLYKQGGSFLLALGALNVGLAVAFALHGEAMLTLVFAVFAILVFFGMPASIKSRVASMKDSRRMTESVTYEFSEEGIKTTTSEKTGKHPGGNFKKRYPENIY